MSFERLVLYGSLAWSAGAFESELSVGPKMCGGNCHIQSYPIRYSGLFFRVRVCAGYLSITQSGYVCPYKSF